jgi:nitrogen regulatory protein P-II 1
MKSLMIVIHNNAQQELSDLLRSMEQVSGFTFSKVEGHGAQSEDAPFLSARDKVVGYSPRTRAEIILQDDDAKLVLKELQKSKMKGAYWITDIESHGRF